MTNNGMHLDIHYQPEKTVMLGSTTKRTMIVIFKTCFTVAGGEYIT